METLNEMTIGELATHAVVILAALSAVVEFVPVKINPLSAVMKWFGNNINGQLMERIGDQDEKLTSMQDAIDDNEIDRIRWEILDFANSCRQGKKHTLDEFDHIIELNQKYHRILERRNLKNGKIDLEYNYIIGIYKECQRENSFL